MTVQRNDELPILSHEAISRWDLVPCGSRLPETVVMEATAAAKKRNWLNSKKEAYSNSKMTQIFTSQNNSAVEVPCCPLCRSLCLHHQVRDAAARRCQ